MTNIPTLVAHRGYMHCYPENSLIGLEAALRAGACILEFDLQMTADGEYMLLHDATLKRTAGKDVSIFESTAERLSQFSVHEPNRFGERFFPTPIPRLTEALQLLKRCPKACALVEIKEESITHWGLKTVLDPLLNALEPYRQQCVLISYEDEILVSAQQQGGWPVGWVLHRYDNNHKVKAQAIQPQLLICNVRKIPQKQLLWQGPWRWMIYDLMNPELALSWADKGAELIETADIGGMLSDPRLVEKACHHGL